MPVDAIVLRPASLPYPTSPQQSARSEHRVRFSQAGHRLPSPFPARKGAERAQHRQCATLAERLALLRPVELPRQVRANFAPAASDTILSRLGVSEREAARSWALQRTLPAQGPPAQALPMPVWVSMKA